MFLLNKKMYYKINDLIPKNNILCCSIINHTQDGMIYVDNTDYPQSFLLRNNAGTYYVSGNLHNKQFVDDLIKYLKTVENHNVYYDLYASSREWIDYIGKELSGNVVRLGRVNFEYNENFNFINTNRIDLPESYHLLEMDENLYEKYIAEIDKSYAMIFSSSHDFLTSSFGYCIIHENAFISACSAYHISENLTEVDVWTNSNYRNKGYATIVVSAFVNHCKEKGLKALWNADSGNAVSIHLAEKCGFEKTFEEQELWWHQDKWQIEHI